MAKRKDLARAYDDKTYAELAKAYMAAGAPAVDSRPSRRLSEDSYGPPVYSIGQGLAQLGADLGTAYFEKKAAAKAKDEQDKNYRDLADAMQGVIGADPSMGDPQSRANTVLAQLFEQNPRVAAQHAPEILEMARGMAPPEPEYNNVPGIGLVKKEPGREPSVAISSPKEEKRYQVGNSLVDQGGNVIYTAPEKAEKPKGAGQLYQDKFGGLVEPGMRPEIVNGEPTGRQIPIEGGSKDAAVIEKKRAQDLEKGLPQAEAKFIGLTSPLQAIKRQIAAAKSDHNTKDVVGSYEGRTGGGLIQGLVSDAKSTAASRIENLRNVAQTVGMTMLRNAAGSAGGTVTEKEWPKFEAFLANLDPRQDEKTFYKQLDEAEKMADSLINAQRREFKNTYGVDPLAEKDGTEGGDLSGSYKVPRYNPKTGEFE